MRLGMLCVVQQKIMDPWECGITMGTTMYTCSEINSVWAPTWIASLGAILYDSLTPVCVMVLISAASTVLACVLGKIPTIH